MPLLLCKKNRGMLILVALAAGTFTVSAVSAQNPQDTSTQTKKPSHKSTSGAGATHTSKNSATKSSTTKKSTKATTEKSSSRRKSKVKGQAAPTPERISEIQDALGKKGAFDGAPSGKWDDSTVDAMKKFQAANGINPTGKLDALTLQKLGLGSETAGLAAPTPPPNSANRLRNQSSSPAEPPAQPSN